MAKLRIVAENIVDTGTIIPTPELAENTVATNLQHFSRSKVARTNSTAGELVLNNLTDTTTSEVLTDTDTGNPLTDTGGGTVVSVTQELFIQLPSVKRVSAAIFGSHTFNEGMQLEIELFSDRIGSTLIISSGVLTIGAADVGPANVAWDAFLGGAPVDVADMSNDFKPRANFVHWFDAVYTGVQSIKITLYLNVEQVEIGRLIIGEYLEPSFNHDYGHKLSWVEKGKQYRTAGYTLRSDITIPYRRFEFSLNTIVDEDRIKLQTDLGYAGKRRDIYVSLYPDNTDVELIKDYSGIVKIIKEPIMSEFANSLYKSK